MVATVRSQGGAGAASGSPDMARLLSILAKTGSSSQAATKPATPSLAGASNLYDISRLGRRGGRRRQEGGMGNLFPLLLFGQGGMGGLFGNPRNLLMARNPLMRQMCQLGGQRGGMNFMLLGTMGDRMQDTCRAVWMMDMLSGKSKMSPMQMIAMTQYDMI